MYFKLILEKNDNLLKQKKYLTQQNIKILMILQLFFAFHFPPLYLSLK